LEAETEMFGTSGELSAVLREALVWVEGFEPFAASDEAANIVG
jgi:hypothetical protein